MCHAQVFCSVDCGGELIPEITQKFQPIQISGGDFIELLFQISRIIILHIFGEEIFKECG